MPACPVSIRDKETRKLVKAVEAAGATICTTGSGHIRITKPGHQPVFASSTPSDHRGSKNLRAMLIREGYLTKETA